MVLDRANSRAQRRFRKMLTAWLRTGSWDTLETRLYTQAERTTDALTVEAEWEQAKAELDALIDADRESDPAVSYHFADDGETVLSSDDQYLAYLEWTQSELREGFGK